MHKPKIVLKKVGSQEGRSEEVTRKGSRHEKSLPFSIRSPIDVPKCSAQIG